MPASMGHRLLGSNEGSSLLLESGIKVSNRPTRLRSRWVRMGNCCRIAFCQLVNASPLLILSLLCPLVVLSRQLVVPLPLAILSLCHPLVNSLHQLVVASPLLVLSLRPAPPSRPLVAPSGCCVASRCAALLLSRHLVVLPLVVSSRQLVVAPSSLAVLSLHRPLVLSLCWLVVALPVLVPPSRPLVVVHRPCHRTPLNAAAAIKHHRHRRH